MVKDFVYLDRKRNLKLKLCKWRWRFLSVSELGEGVELSDVLITNLSGNCSCAQNDGKLN